MGTKSITLYIYFLLQVTQINLKKWHTIHYLVGLGIIIPNNITALYKFLKINKIV